MALYIFIGPLDGCMIGVGSSPIYRHTSTFILHLIRFLHGTRYILKCYFDILTMLTILPIDKRRQRHLKKNNYLTISL